MNQLARNNKVASAGSQREVFKAESQQKRNDDKQPNLKKNLGLISGNAFDPIFIVASKPEFVIQMQSKTDSVEEKRRGLLSMLGMSDNRLKQIQQIWTTLPDGFSGRVFRTVNASEVSKVFCDETFRKEDVLIVSGVIQVIIGIGTLLAASVAGYQEKQKVRSRLGRESFHFRIKRSLDS